MKVEMQKQMTGGLGTPGRSRMTLASSSVSISSTHRFTSVVLRDESVKTVGSVMSGGSFDEGLGSFAEQEDDDDEDDFDG
jgi:hypothetical protein